MQNNPVLKILLGVGSALYLIIPLLAFISWLVAFPVIMISSNINGGDPPAGFFAFFGLFMFSILCANLLHFILVPVYIVLILQNQRAQDVLRILLGIGLFFMPFIAVPAYYLIYVLPAQPPAWALQANPTAGETSLD